MVLQLHTWKASVLLMCSTNFGVLDSHYRQVIAPETMETLENIGFTNAFHEFGSKYHGQHQ